MISLTNMVEMWPAFVPACHAYAHIFVLTFAKIKNQQKSRKKYYFIHVYRKMEYFISDEFPKENFLPIILGRFSASSQANAHICACILVYKCHIRERYFIYE